METPPKWLTTGFLALFALLPWSLDVGFGTWNLRLPSEPLIVCLGIGLVYVFWQQPQAFRGVFSTSIFLKISLAYIVWMAVSACFSSLPIVSWKYWVVAAGHWWVFAVGISVWPNLWKRAFPWFAWSMVGVALYAMVHHGFYHFRADQAMLAPMPFFPDHTMWAAAVVMVLFMGGMAFRPSGNAPFTAQNEGVNTLFPDGLKAIPPIMILITALVLSTARAAWLSVLLAGFVWSFLYFGKKGRVILLLLLLLTGVFFGKQTTQSLSQDVSSLERINRWHCAFRMAQEKPVLGFGPGTFQFQYIDFQQDNEMTRISIPKTSEGLSPYVYGRGGGAHSEYLRALAETGWPGLLLWLGLLVPTTLVAGIPGKKNPMTPHEYQQGMRSWSLFLALLTFFAHGVVNDFLHDGRIAALVWGGMALLFAKAEEK